MCTLGTVYYSRTTEFVILLLSIECIQESSFYLTEIQDGGGVKKLQEKVKYS